MIDVGVGWMPLDAYLKLKVFITLSQRFFVGIYYIRDKHKVEAFSNMCPCQLAKMSADSLILRSRD